MILIEGETVFIYIPRIINDQNVANPCPKFSAGSFDVTNRRLYLRLNEDSNYDGKTYQNVALCGFKDCMLTPCRDVFARTVMQASPDLFSTAGIVFDRANTFNDDGSDKPGSTFDKNTSRKCSFYVISWLSS